MTKTNKKPVPLRSRAYLLKILPFLLCYFCHNAVEQRESTVSNYKQKSRNIFLNIFFSFNP